MTLAPQEEAAKLCSARAVLSPVAGQACVRAWKDTAMSSLRAEVVVLSSVLVRGPKLTMQALHAR
ncbi:hypothetical protein ACGF0D_09450 [Kitasatospora sp. NPDC048298]|uniref:hypothetical protein n=1 Tax=Kitasatospora sp. NPDC048298 TaxID=3364049 RepID=UPI003712A407